MVNARIQSMQSSANFDEKMKAAQLAYKAYKEHSHPGVELNKKQWAYADPEHMILDGCMVYASRSSIQDYFFEKHYYHIPLFKDMFSQYLEAHGNLYLGQTKVFFVNMFDHPIILKDVLNTKFLMSCDSKEVYADVPFPYADVWLAHRKIDL